MSVFLNIERWDQIPAATIRMQAAGAEHRVPILQALRTRPRERVTRLWRGIQPDPRAGVSDCAGRRVQCRSLGLIFGCIADWAWRWMSTYPDQSHTLPNGRLLIPSKAASGLFEAARAGGWGPPQRALQDYQNGGTEYFVELHWSLDDAAFRRALNEAVLRSAVIGAVH